MLTAFREFRVRGVMCIICFATCWVRWFCGVLQFTGGSVFFIKGEEFWRQMGLNCVETSYFL